MSTDSLISSYRAADAPLSGVVIAPPTERTSERSPHSPPFSSNKRPRKNPAETEPDKGDVNHSRDDGHLVDDYA